MFGAPSDRLPLPNAMSASALLSVRSSSDHEMLQLSEAHKTFAALIYKHFYSLNSVDL